MSKSVKRVAVLGANGLLGHPIHRVLESRGVSVLALTRKDFDLSSHSITPLTARLERERVDAVVNCAAVIRPFIESYPIEQVIRVNTVFPQDLARYCLSRDLPCLHFSTDCVFDGLAGPYVESDWLTGTDVYGLTKAGGDAASCMVIRCTLLGEERGRQHALLEWIKSQRGQAIGGFTNRPWNGVTAPTMAQVVANILLAGHYELGVTHIHSPDTVSRFELFQIVNEVFDLKMTISASEAQGVCDRTLKSLRHQSAALVTEPVAVQVQQLLKEKPNA